jgi:hypothetical protein
MSADTTDGDPKGRRKGRQIKVIMRRSIDGARQMIHHGPFRIAEPLDFVIVSKDALAGQEDTQAGRMTAQNMDADFKHVLQTVAAVATALWRVRTKLESESNAELPSELRHLPRHIQAAWDALASGGVQVQDPRGQRYVPGMAVNPITFQPMEGVGTEIIHETIKPSVFYKDVLIQRADVIVARPVEDKATTTLSGPADDQVSLGDQADRPGMPGQATADSQQVNPEQ